ncbi:hypothetical protein PsYK624_110050 [Phanerochaete sordida]|uniref:Uncharacterized protein n=1 Tax=Phanerochaete sordida TaxID=48140 RepID=A0A9P3GJP8_9APHY|nr:hypothetical protein PsYK624_110050 [Phanerochaete sordida]
MASTSRRRTQKARSPSDTFRPKFPLDPFAAAAAAAREPWYITADSLPSVASQGRRDVFLALGAPSPQDLDALLSSKQLANSLLLIASHEPPTIPHTTLPTVRVLRLDGPLAIEQAGAVRFVNVLEWAERVARLWRRYGGYGAAELTGEDDGLDYLTPPSILRFRSSQSTPSSPRSSTTQLSDPRASISTVEFGRPGRPRSVSSRLLGRARQLSLPAVDPSQRPFDGIINFLPAEVSDKALLKQAILVTTISRPFLISNGPLSSDRGSRKSIFASKSTTSVYLPPTPPTHSRDSLSSLPLAPGKAHLVHVFPAESRSLHSFARSKLVQSLEAFLLSFGGPTALDFHGAADDLADRLKPYIMTAGSLGQTFATGAGATSTSPYDACPSDCCLAELVLCGSLDGEDPHSRPQSDRTRALVTRLTPRALLTQASDVVLLADDAPVVIVSQSDPGHMAPPMAGRLPRENSTSSSSSASSSSMPGTPSSFSSLRSTSPRSPLAMSETITGIAGLPTPPDSEESGGENGAEDVAYRPRKQVPANAPAKSKDVAVAGPRVKKMRWKFWNRAKS